MTLTPRLDFQATHDTPGALSGEGDLSGQGDTWNGGEFVGQVGEPGAGAVARAFAPTAIVDPYRAAEVELERIRFIWRQRAAAAPGRPRATAPFRSRSLRRVSS